MASTGKGKRKQKGKTMDLHSFLQDKQAAPEGFTIVNTAKTWAEAMEDEELDDKFTLDYKKDTPSATNKVILPTAPKAVRSSAVDESKVPNKPPFKAYLGNLPYEVSEDDIVSFFKKLRVKDVQLPREGGRMRGFGYAEFEDRNSLIEALSLNSETLRNRQIRVSLSLGDTDPEKQRRGDDREDRTAGDWRNAPRDQLPPRDKDRDQRYNRELRNGSDFDQYRGGSFERRAPQDRGYDRGFDRSYRPPRDDFERPHDRRNDRFEPRNDRRDFGNNFERRRFNQPQGTSPSPTPLDEQQAPKERPKLALKPRSVPNDSSRNEPATNSAIFAGAKPVDTAARERIIEERLLKEKEELEKKEDVDKMSRPVSESPIERGERVRRTSSNSNYSGTNRSRRGSETEKSDRRSPRESFDLKYDEPPKRNQEVSHTDREFRPRRTDIGDNSRRDNHTYRENREFRSKGRQEHESSSDEQRDVKGSFRDEFKRSARPEDDEGYHSNYQRSGNHGRNTRGINSGDRGFDTGQNRKNRPIVSRSNFSSKRGGSGSDNRTNSFDSVSQNRASVPKEKSDSRPQSKLLDQDEAKEVEYTSTNKYASLRDDFQDDVEGASH